MPIPFVRGLTQCRRSTSNIDDGVDWTRIQPILESAPCDKLIVLNCCFGGNAALSGRLGTTEILAAANRDEVAYSLEHSFLRALVEVLTNFGTSRFTVDKLYEKLDAYNKPDVEHLRINHPFHRRYPEQDVSSILIQPLRPLSHSASSTWVEEHRHLDSFFVQIFVEPPEELDLNLVSEPGLDSATSSSSNSSLWTSFFANARWPKAVQKIEFYTPSMLQGSRT